MAAKKKPSAAQLRARKLFAQRARSGAFAKKRKEAAAPRRAARAPRARARSSNPAGAIAPTKYAVHRATADGKPGVLLGSFPKKDDAVAYGRAVAKSRRCPVVIIGKR